MVTALIECYYHEMQSPDMPCSNSLSSIMRGLYIRKFVDLKSFIIRGLPTLGFFLTQNGKSYVEENLLKDQTHSPLQRSDSVS